MTDKINIIADFLSIFDFETITVGAAAVGLTEAAYTDSEGRIAKKALMTVETASLRWRCDADPTDSVGHLLQPGDSLILNSSSNIKSFKAIRTGNNAKISVSYSL
jgi:uncharacterized Zn ribbon protein